MPNTFFDYLINFDIMLKTNHKFWSTATLSRPVKPLSSAGVTLFNKNESVRVTKSKNFPDSKIFVAKTFQIKHVNRVNFQIREKCA